MLNKKKKPYSETQIYRDATICMQNLTKTIIQTPKKVYIQEVRKGVKFIGAMIKPNRIYIGNRTKGNFWNTLKTSHEFIKDNKPTEDDIGHFICSVNSYLGFMIHYNSFNIRRKMLVSNFMYPWYRYCHTTNRFSKLITA